jgi:hypothetical protein
MPTIAQATRTLDTAAIPIPDLLTSAPALALAMPLRGILPPDLVLDTVTARAIAGASINLPFSAVYKNASMVITKPVSTTKGSPLSAGLSGTPGVPSEVLEVSASQEPYKLPSGTVECLVSVTYKNWQNDPYFAGVQIWFTGYEGSKHPQLMAEGQQSSVSFTCEATHETVIVTVVAYGPTGATASFADAPTVALLLSGVVSAPPPPTISQAVVAISGGWQFAWNVETGVVGDVIAGYWVYKSTSSTTPKSPAGRVRFFSQPSTGLGTITYQDIDASTEYFWVSAVNSSGLESTLTPANVSTVSTVLYPATDSGTYSSPQLAFDGNENTPSTAYESVYGWPGGTIAYAETWSGWATFTGVYTGATLQILMQAVVAQVNGTGPQPVGNTSVSYSLDGGTTWTLASYSSSSIAKGYLMIPLGLGQDMTQVQVKAASSIVSTAYTPVLTGPLPVVPSLSVEHLIYQISISLAGVS